MKRIGIYAENKLPPNIEKLLLNLGEMLNEKYQLDVIGEFSPTEEILEFYEHRSYCGEEKTEGLQRIKQAYLNCQKYARKENPDVLFQITKFSIYGLPVSLVGRSYDIPTVLRISGDTYKEYKIKKYDTTERFKILLMNNTLSRISLKLADRIVVLSDYLREEAKRHGCPQEKLRVIPQPVNTRRFSPVSSDQKIELRSQLGLPKDKDIALVVGRLTKAKGIEMIEKTLDNLSGEDQIHFALIGEGSYGPALEEKYPQTVDHVGFVPFEEIDRYYKAADLLVHPSQLEGIPNTVLEGMASGLSVIVRKANYVSGMDIPTFEDERELLELIKQRPKTELFDDFKWDHLKKKYIELFSEL